jgi:hypothetical protein
MTNICNPSTFVNGDPQPKPQQNSTGAFNSSGSTLPLNRDDAETFLDALDPAARFFTFQTFDDNAERKDKQLTRILHGTLGARWNLLADLNRRGAGIFVTVNATDGEGRNASCSSTSTARRCRRKTRSTSSRTSSSSRRPASGTATGW